MSLVNPFLIACTSLLCIAYTFVTFSFVCHFVTLRVPRWAFYIGVILLSGTVPVICIMYLSYPVLFVTLYIFMIIVFCITCNGTLLSKLYTACFFVFQLLVVKGAVYGVYAIVNHQTLFVAASNKNTHFLVTIIAFIINIAIMILYIEWQKRNNLKLSPKQYRFMFIIINILYFVLCIDTFSYHVEIDFDIFTLYHVVLYVIIYFTFLIIYSSTIKASLYQEHTTILEGQLEKQLAHYNTQADYIQNYRTLTEVYSSQIRGLNYVSETNNLETIQDYIRKMDIVSPVATKIETFSNNLLVDAILQDAYVECAKNDIEFAANIDIAEQLKLTDFDIAAIFSHLVNNALTAVKKCNPEQKPFIRFYTDNNVDWITYTFENSYDSKNKHVVTGIQSITTSGLKQTEKFIAKYDGLLVVEPRLDVFCITVTFPLTKTTSVS